MWRDRCRTGDYNPQLGSGTEEEKPKAGAHVPESQREKACPGCSQNPHRGAVRVQGRQRPEVEGHCGIGWRLQLWGPRAAREAGVEEQGRGRGPGPRSGAFAEAPRPCLVLGPREAFGKMLSVGPGRRPFGRKS